MNVEIYGVYSKSSNLIGLNRYNNKIRVLLNITDKHFRSFQVS